VDFVIGADGNLYLGRRHQYLAKEGGNKTQVLAAGELIIKRGKIIRITNFSGHFQPTESQARRSAQLLRSFGLDLKGTTLRIMILDNSAANGERQLPDTVLD